MATKDPVQQDIEADPVLTEAVVEQVASVSTPAANTAQYIDGQKVDPVVEAKKAVRPEYKGTPLVRTRKDGANPDDEREGFDKAYKETFGFEISNSGGESSNMDMGGASSSTGSSVYLADHDDDGYGSQKSIQAQQTQMLFDIADDFTGGNGSEFGYEAHAFGSDRYNFTNAYDNRFSLDNSNDRNFLSGVTYHDDYIDSGNGCMRYGGDFDVATRPLIENMNAWKTDSAIVQKAQEAIIDEETGMVYVNGQYLDPKTDPEAQKIVAAKIGMATEPEKAAPMAFKSKAELDAMAAENPLFKKPEILARNDVTGGAPPLVAAKKDSVFIATNGQGGDLGYAYQSIDEITASVTKGNGLTTGAPGIDPMAEIMKPKPVPAAAMAGPAPMAPAPV